MFLILDGLVFDIAKRVRLLGESWFVEDPGVVDLK